MVKHEIRKKLVRVTWDFAHYMEPEFRVSMGKVAGDGTQNPRYQNHSCLRKTVDSLAAGPSVRGSDEFTDLRREGSLT